jgi:hypothetical protein
VPSHDVFKKKNKAECFFNAVLDSVRISGFACVRKQKGANLGLKRRKKNLSYLSFCPYLSFSVLFCIIRVMYM